MLTHILSLCLGFIAAVLCSDLVFDLSFRTSRRSGEALAPESLAPLITHYRYMTRDPRLFLLVILAANGCVALEILCEPRRRWLGYLSLVLLGPASLAGVLKALPTAQRLASARDDLVTQGRLAQLLLAYHAALLAAVVLTAAVRLVVACRS